MWPFLLAPAFAQDPLQDAMELALEEALLQGELPPELEQLLEVHDAVTGVLEVIEDPSSLSDGFDLSPVQTGVRLMSQYSTGNPMAYIGVGGSGVVLVRTSGRATPFQTVGHALRELRGRQPIDAILGPRALWRIDEQTSFPRNVALYLGTTAGPRRAGLADGRPFAEILPNVWSSPATAEPVLSLGARPTPLWGITSNGPCAETLGPVGDTLQLGATTSSHRPSLSLVPTDPCAEETRALTASLQNTTHWGQALSALGPLVVQGVDDTGLVARGASFTAVIALPAPGREITMTWTEDPRLPYAIGVLGAVGFLGLLGRGLRALRANPD